MDTVLSKLGFFESCHRPNRESRLRQGIPNCIPDTSRKDRGGISCGVVLRKSLLYNADLVVVLTLLTSHFPSLPWLCSSDIP